MSSSMENARSYFLDISTLITILARQQRSGTLQAEAVHIPGMRGTAFVSLSIVNGVIQSCHIIQKQQKVLDGEKAFSALLLIPAIEWLWQPFASSPPQSSPVRGQLSPSENRAVYPQQTSLARDNSILQQLSRNHRRVLSLCDGTRSLDKIANMLLMSPKDLSVYVQDLEKWGHIRFR